jgi:site-specific DNA-methyltransferase (adenine-specific)
VPTPRFPGRLGRLAWITVGNRVSSSFGCAAAITIAPPIHTVTRFPTPHTTVRAGRATLRFYLGDCVEVLARLPSASIGTMVTSPPYNLGVQYRSYDDTIPRAAYLEWTDSWIAAATRVIDPAGSLFLNVGAKPTDPWTALDVAQATRVHLHLQNTIHWIKSIAIEKAAAGARAGLADDIAVGHYKPINSQRFLHDCHEFVFHFTPGGHTPLDRRAVGVKYQDRSNVGRWRTAASGVRCRGNTWFIPYDTIQSRDQDRPHPATFPSRLPEMCIRLHGLERAGTVADPFLGLGSTAVACAELGLNFVGVEMDESYLEDAVRRVRETVETRRTNRRR